MSQPAPTDAQTIRDREAGLARLEAILDDLDPAALAAIAAHGPARRAADQPWLIAGCSDGMGLHITLAALAAGVLKRGVAVYYEPPAFLGRDASGTPLSPVHHARYQNALALETVATRLGAELTVLQADLCLAPARGMKGQVKGEVRPLPADVVAAVDAARDACPEGSRDLVLLDSVAFAKWICPRQDAPEALRVPSVALDGSVVTMATKPWHARGYAETLDTMGRNHGYLLEAARTQGWLGRDALTLLLTWAGGSQRVALLEGIYGRGALGDAKIEAEADVVRFRLAHGETLGAHAVVRLPAFLSVALMAIPGGGLFGLVERRVLEEAGCLESLGDLAVGTLDSAFGPEWVRENPLAQLELDTAEMLHLATIEARLADAHARIAAHRAASGDPDGAIPAAEAREVLSGLIPEQTETLLARFQPTLDPPEVTRLTLGPDALGSGQAPFMDRLLATVAEHVPAGLWPASATLAVEAAPEGRGELTLTLRHAPRGDGATLRLDVEDASRTRVAHANVTLAPTPRADWHPRASALGEAIGYRMTLTDPAPTPLALAAWAEAHLRELGLAPPSAAARREVTLYRAAEPGERVLTFAGHDGERRQILVVDDDLRALARLVMREIG